MVVQVCVLKVRVVGGSVLRGDGYSFAVWVDCVEEDGHEEELCMVA